MTGAWVGATEYVAFGVQAATVLVLVVMWCSERWERSWWLLPWVALNVTAAVTVFVLEPTP